jgi:hypothetical protein
MISCQVCWRITEMAQRSNRRFPNLISATAHRGQIFNREESGRNPSWPGVADSTKGRIHWRRPNCHLQISLANKRRTIHADIVPLPFPTPLPFKERPLHPAEIWTTLLKKNLGDS